jgi:hypothetical protein
VAWSYRDRVLYLDPGRLPLRYRHYRQHDGECITWLLRIHTRYAGRLARATRRQAHGADVAAFAIRPFICRRWYSLLCLLLIIWLVYVQIVDRPVPDQGWDWLQHTGAIVFLVALCTSLDRSPLNPSRRLNRLPLAASADANEVNVESAEPVAAQIATQVRVSATD